MALRGTPSEPSAERLLACSVIELAWVDYLGFDRQLSDQAREWFLNPESSFPGWCTVAGLGKGTPERIRRKVIDTTPLWLDLAEAQALGLPEPNPKPQTRQRIQAVTASRGRKRKSKGSKP